MLYAYMERVFCITKVKFRHKCYWNQQLLLAGCIIQSAGFIFISEVPTKITSLHNFLAILIQIRFNVLESSTANKRVRVE
ncbi:hypothetical protein T09_13170 [Trichinella sp. T9]|nr:hypothetical protein T09_13170 [Trichinella sp. T9]